MGTLVVGGAGFVGKRLLRVFNREGVQCHVADIKSTSSSEVDIFLDVSKSETFENIPEVDTIINLAAEHRDNVRPASRYFDVNVKGAMNICDAARRMGVTKIIFTSSVAIYGFCEGETDETGEPNYFNEYGRTKFLAEQVYREWYEEAPDQRCLVIIRPTVIFGEGNRGNVYNLLRQVASGYFVMFGSGENQKSMAYVDNVAEFLYFTSRYSIGIHIHNYVDKPDLSMNEVVRITRRQLKLDKALDFRLPAFVGLAGGWLLDRISSLLKRPFPVSLIRIKKFMASTRFVSTTIPSEFVAPTELRAALARTIAAEFEQDHGNTES